MWPFQVGKGGSKDLWWVSDDFLTLNPGRAEDFAQNPTEKGPQIQSDPGKEFL